MQGIGVTSPHQHGSGAEAAPFFADLLKVYTPRQVCMFGEPAVIWLHALSDLLIGLSYYSIPIALAVLLRRRRDLAFSGMFWMFAGFMLACGTTHFFSVAALWAPVYRVDGLVKLGTGVLSFVTAGVLWRHLPAIAALPSLNQSEEQLRQLADSIPQLAWMANPDGWIFWYNQRWYQYTGTTPEQMEGWGWQRVHDPGVLPRVAERWRESIATGRPFEMEFPLRGADGSFRTFLTRVEPIRDEQGRVLRWFGTNTDIDDKRRFLEERERLLESERAARETAEHASRLKDEFLATVSHELRTPLNSIAGWSQLLLNPKITAEEVRKGLETILRNTRSQTRIVDDLLDMSRIVSGQVRLDAQSVDLLHVLETALDTMRPTAEAKGVRIETSLQPAGPIKGDPGRLQQVFWNLLSNAIRFTPSGGVIRVALARADTHLEVTVSDTGEGIDPDFLPFVFDRFRQQDSTTTRRHGGLGLGLSIVKSLVELHGGEVRAWSAGSGQGATFTVRLPAGAGGAQEADGASS